MAAVAMAKVAITSAGELFTRGGPDVPETRGESMVQKHMDMLRRERETAALVAVRDAFPDLGAAVCIVALEASDWEVDAAVHLLDAFHTVKGPPLEELAQERKRRHAERGDLVVDAAAPIPESRPESGADDGSDDDDNSASDSGSDRRRSRKRNREKEHGKHSKHKRRKKEEKESARKEKRGKKDKAEKKESRRKDTAGKDAASKKETGEQGPVTNQYGAHGVIREGDLGAKRAEFQAWAIETQNVDIEALGKAEEKELFRTYVEDFNTSTLPHRKFYNLEFYHREKAARARKKGHSEVQEKTVFDDEAEVRRERAAKRAAEDSERLKDAYNALVYTDMGKADDMREQQLMRLQMRQAYRTGDHATAEKLANKLKPDDPRLEVPQRPNF